MYSSNANDCLDSDMWLEKSSQEEYGCHSPKFINNLREKKCIFCGQWIPSSLEELAFSGILENEELFKRFDSALHHLPQRICGLIGHAINANLLTQVWKLVGFVSEFCETQPSWFNVDKSKTVELSRFLLFCTVHQKLKPYMNRQSAGIDRILRYLSNVDNTYEDFWYEMTRAMTSLRAEIVGEDLESLRHNSIICAGKNNVVLVKNKELIEEFLPDSREYKAMKKLQGLNKTFPCPVAFTPAAIDVAFSISRKIPNLLYNIDTEMIVDVDLTKRAWSVGDFEMLEHALSVCRNISVIYLRQTPTLNEVREGYASAISKLLSHHHKLKKIGLEGFNLSRTLTRYPLPSVNNLQLRRCSFMNEDLIFMANRSDLIVKFLVVTTYFEAVHFPSLCVFIEAQAKSLETLELEYPTVLPTEICNFLRIMAKYDKLQVFRLYSTQLIDFMAIKDIIINLMSIHSTKKFFININTISNVSGYEAKINIDDVMKELCKVNRRPPISFSLEINAHDL